MKKKLKKIKVISLKKISNTKGDVWHAVKSNEKHFYRFGELYFSWIKPGKIKAWKYHKKMTMSLIVPVGNVLCVFFDEYNKKFVKINIGDKNYKKIIVPPGYIFGFKNISNNKSLIANFADIIHDKNEQVRINQKEIKYSWKK